MLLAFIFVISNAFAEPKSTTIEAGRPAPYAGTLLNAEAVASILAESEAADARCKTKLEETSAIQDAKYKHQIYTITLKSQDCERRLDELNEEYKTLSLKYNRLTKTTPIVTGLAFASGIALTLFIAHSM